MINGPETLNLIRNALNDSDNSVVELAAVSLGFLHDQDSVQALIDLFDKSEETGIKKEALRALGRIGSRKSVSFLTKVLERKGWFIGKKEDELKVVCVSAMADAGTTDAVKALEEAGIGSSRESVKKACEDALKRTRHG